MLSFILTTLSTTTSLLIPSNTQALFLSLSFSIRQAHSVDKCKRNIVVTAGNMICSHVEQWVKDSVVNTIIMCKSEREQIVHTPNCTPDFFIYLTYTVRPFISLAASKLKLRHSKEQQYLWALNNPHTHIFFRIICYPSKIHLCIWGQRDL